jgi:hypothetical protein
VQSLDRWVQDLWTISVATQIGILGLLVFRGHVRKLPFFTAYIALNLLQAATLYEVYKQYGTDTHIAYVVGWRSEAITLFARLCATVEVLRLVMIYYRGIWGLTWRLLAASALVVLVYAGFSSDRSADWMLIKTDRAYHLVFTILFGACLLLIRYYFIPIERVYRTLLISFCFYSCTKVLINTVFQGFYSKFANFGQIWQLVTISCYVVVLLLWVAALRHALPKPSAQPEMLTASAYRQISPKIYEHLRSINEQLMNFWKDKERKP